MVKEDTTTGRAALCGAMGRTSGQEGQQELDHIPSRPRRWFKRFWSLIPSHMRPSDAWAVLSRIACGRVSRSRTNLSVYQSGFLSWCLGCQLRLPWGSSSSFAIQRCPSFVIQRLEENMFVIVRHEEIRRDSEVVRHEEIRRRNSGAGRGGGDCNCKVRNTLIVRVWCCKISTIGDETHRGVVVVVCRDQEFL